MHMKQTHTQTHESSTCKLTVLFYTSASFRLYDRREKLDAQMPAGLGFTLIWLRAGVRGSAEKKNTNQSCVELPLAACARIGVGVEWCGVAM